jgi:hypothetical protein
MGAIDETIDTAIELTDLILTRAPEYAGDAIASLRNLHDQLANAIPQHAAFRKLSRYMDAIATPIRRNTLQ